MRQAPPANNRAASCTARQITRPLTKFKLLEDRLCCTDSVGRTAESKIDFGDSTTRARPKAQLSPDLLERDLEVLTRFVDKSLP